MEGENYEGCFFVSGDQRIKDMLNGDNAFVPFETLDGEIVILNRNAIARVVPQIASKAATESQAESIVA